MIVVGNGRMITRDGARPYLESGAVALDGSVIRQVGTTEEIRGAYPEAEFIDAKGGVIMPAFINVHEHIYSAFARGLSINGYNPKGFLDISRRPVVDHRPASDPGADLFKRYGHLYRLYQERGDHHL